MPFYGSRISERVSETPEGFLICHGAPLCRTATRVPQKYRRSELGMRGSDSLINVYRTAEEVFSKRFMASLEGKPVTDTHPTEFLNAQNTGWFVRGHVQNVREGPNLPDGERSVIADLVIHDAPLIHKIKSGVRDLSVGYQCKYVDNGNGTYSQTQLAGNHVAVVPNGRAGEHVKILDSEQKPLEDFSIVCRAYRSAPNPSSVAGARSKQSVRRTTDGADGAPRSWDDLAAELHNRYDEFHDENEGEIDMNPELNEKLTLVLQGLQTLLEERQQPSRAEEEEVIDAHPALASLRRLRPVIEASGDRTAIDAYNTAIRGLRKRSASSLVSVSDERRTPEDAARAFDEAVRRAREKLSAKTNGRSNTVTHRVEDSDESFEDSVKRHRRRLLAG